MTVSCLVEDVEVVIVEVIDVGGGWWWLFRWGCGVGWWGGGLLVVEGVVVCVEVAPFGGVGCLGGGWWWGCGGG